MTENFQKPIFNGQVEWGKNQDGKWHSLFNTDFSNLLGSGVSIIWCDDNENPPFSNLGIHSPAVYRWG